MASCMAVSAETNATVIKTRARSSMRKNWRIAEDYSCFSIYAARPLKGHLNSRGLMASLKRCPDTKLRALSFLQLLRCCVVVSRIATRLFPVISAGMAGPSLFVERDRNTGVGSHVGDGLVQFFKADVERLAAGAFRLL